jgi:hypothetical protein
VSGPEGEYAGMGDDRDGSEPNGATARRPTVDLEAYVSPR